MVTIREFVQNGIYANITDMMDYLIDYSNEGGKYVEWGEFENCYVSDCPHCGGEVTHNYDDEIECPYCSEIFDGTEDYREPEVLQWFIVSGSLGARLADKGEAVLERNMGWIWGRQTCGQSIVLDSVIQEIYTEIFGVEPEI